MGVSLRVESTHLLVVTSETAARLLLRRQSDRERSALGLGKAIVSVETVVAAVGLIQQP